MHHVNHVRKIGEKITGFKRIMASLNRKQICVCKNCHRKIHMGQYNGKKLSELTSQAEVY